MCFLDYLLWGLVVVDLCESQTSNCFTCGSKDLGNFTAEVFHNTERLALSIMTLLEADFLCNSGPDSAVDEVFVTIPNDMITPYEIVVFGIGELRFSKFFKLMTFKVVF